MPTVIVIHKATGKRAVIVGYSAVSVIMPPEDQTQEPRMMIQPTVGVTFLDDDMREPAVHTVAQEDIVAEEVIDDEGERIDNYDTGEEPEPEGTEAEPAPDDAPKVLPADSDEGSDAKPVEPSDEDKKD